MVNLSVSRILADGQNNRDILLFTLKFLWPLFQFFLTFSDGMYYFMKNIFIYPKCIYFIQNIFNTVCVIIPFVLQFRFFSVNVPGLWFKLGRQLENGFWVSVWNSLISPFTEIKEWLLIVLSILARTVLSCSSEIGCMLVAGLK